MAYKPNYETKSDQLLGRWARFWPKIVEVVCRRFQVVARRLNDDLHFWPVRRLLGGYLDGFIGRLLGGR